MLNGNVIWLKDYSVDRAPGIEAAMAYLERRPEALRREIRRQRAMAIGAALCALLALVDGLLLWAVIR